MRGNIHIEPLQYIIQQDDEFSPVEQINQLAPLGIKWFQLRLKNVDANEYLSIAEQCVKTTHKYGAKLIINDNLNVALTSQADGVHLGLNDLPTQKAAEVVPEKFIIGGTANTFDDYLHHLPWVNYVGMGPYQETKTKNNLSPILGIDGYSEICEKIKKGKHAVPVIAIGGIGLLDLPFLATTHINGVAISGEIYKNINNKKHIQQIIASVNAIWKI